MEIIDTKTPPAFPCRKKWTHWTEVDIRHALGNLGFALNQEYTGNIQDDHWIVFPSGSLRRVNLGCVLRGESSGKRHMKHTTDSINNRLSEVGAELAEEYKGSVKEKHLVAFSDGETRNVFLNNVLSGRSRNKKVPQHTTETANKALASYGAILLEPCKGHGHLHHRILFSCGHEHQTRLHNALAGQGCPKCSKTGFDRNKSAFLYFLEVRHGIELLYKVGITNSTVEKRYQREGVNPVILSLFHTQNGDRAFQAEQSILKAFDDHLYDGASPFRITGTTEIFNVDIRHDPQFSQIIDDCGLEQVQSTGTGAVHK